MCLCSYFENRKEYPEYNMQQDRNNLHVEITKKKKGYTFHEVEAIFCINLF